MTFVEARDATLTVFKEIWVDDLGYKAFWIDTTGEEPRDGQPYARVIFQHHEGRQGSLADEHGAQIYDRTGTAMFELYAPVGDGLTDLYNLSQMVVNAYQAAKLDVWFRNVRISEGGTSNTLYHAISVLVDFEYTDVK